LDALYPIVYLDCIHVKTRDNGAVRAKAVYLALGINLAGEKELLGLCIAQTEGAKFWLHVVTELKNRGVQDIFIACVDGLKGFPEAIETVFPKTAMQLCTADYWRTSIFCARLGSSTLEIIRKMSSIKMTSVSDMLTGPVPRPRPPNRIGLSVQSAKEAPSGLVRI